MNRKTFFTGRKTLLFLIIPLLLGTFLRFYGLGDESLWLDEALVIAHASEEGLRTVIQSVASDLHPPLYPLLLHFWMTFGKTEVAVRFLSALFGILTIIGIYYLGGLFFDRKTGLISSFLLAISPIHIYYSQETRPYVLLTLLGLISVYSLLQVLAEQRRGYWIGFIISSVLCLYTHYYGVFIYLFEIIFFILLIVLQREKKGLIKAWLLAQAVILLLFLPWGPTFISQFSMVVVRPRSWVEAPLSLIVIPQTIMDFFTFGIPSRAIAFLGSLVFLPCLIWGTFKVEIEKAQCSLHLPFQMKRLLLLGYLLAPMFLAFIFSFLKPIYLDRYLLICLVPACILLAQGIRDIKSKTLKGVIMVSLLLSFGTSLHYMYKYQTKEDWREVAGFIVANSNPNDVICLNASFIQTPFDYYYKGNLKRVGFDREMTDREEIGLRINEIAKGHKRLWLILSHTTNNALECYLVFYDKRLCYLGEKKFIGKIRVLLFKIEEA